MLNKTEAAFPHQAGSEHAAQLFQEAVLTRPAPGELPVSLPLDSLSRGSTWHFCLDVPLPSGSPVGGAGTYLQDGEPGVVEEGLQHHREVLPRVVAAGLHQLKHAALGTHPWVPSAQAPGGPRAHGARVGVVGRAPPPWEMGVVALTQSFPGAEQANTLDCKALSRELETGWVTSLFCF